MASTTTLLIQTIDPTFPVAGQDNDTEGFRTNFNIIQSSLLAINTVTESLQSTLSALAGNTLNVNAPYVTGTHVVARQDLTIGSNVISTGTDFNTVIRTNGGAGNVVLANNTVTTSITGYFVNAGTDADWLTLSSTENILTSSTFRIGGVGFTITNITTATNTCTTDPQIGVASLSSLPYSISISNPFPAGVASLGTLVSSAFSSSGLNVGGVVTATNFAISGSTATFVSSTGTNGYQQLPGGLIMQWGTVGPYSSETGIAVTFPMAFPNTTLNAQATLIANSTGNIDHNDHIAQVYSVTRTGMSVYSQLASSDGLSNPNWNIYWFAIGC